MTDHLKASISRGSLDVEAFGRRYRVPYHSAAEWMTALSEPEFITSVFPGLLREQDSERVADMLMDGRAEVRGLKAPAFDLISRASGFRWWEAVTLVGMADGSPNVMGELTLSGVDPESIPFGRWCAAVYTLATRNLDEKERTKWLARFNAPPPGEEESDEGMAFTDMVRGLQGIPGARIG